ncbi:hypothetical protein [Bacillus sp. JJ722]|uniref:hypothetical protein n=1 Tax=Bacillus sp. JJ722 TaxID=3122973 RepID=UPI002FFF95A9
MTRDELGELFEQLDIIQEGQDLSCGCTECYWNLWNPPLRVRIIQAKQQNNVFQKV